MDAATSRTTTALLRELAQSPGEAADAAWFGFDARYRPLLARLFQRLGFGDADAADLSQETLLRFVRDYRRGGYDRRSGRLRDWLLAIARSRAIDARRKRAVATVRDTALGHVVGRSELDAAFGEAWSEHVLAEALSLLRRASGLDERTVHAFEETAVRGRAAADVARDLEVSTSAVYVARHRAMTRLRELRSEVEAALGDDALPGVAT